MKSKILKHTGTFAGALLLTLMAACGPAKQPAVETKEVVTNAAPTAFEPVSKPVAVAEAVKTPAPVAPPQPAAPGGAMRYDAQPTGSKMTIAGTSTMHDWTMESSIVGGSLEGDAKFPESALTDASAAKPTVQVFTPVRSFKSYAKKMDSVMQEHMREIGRASCRERVL